MTCTGMLDRMLEADLEELEGRGESDVARHVRLCSRCQGVARQLLRETHALALAISTTTPIALGRSVAHTARPLPSRPAGGPNIRRVMIAVGIAACGVWLVREIGDDPAPAPSPTRGYVVRAPASPPAVVATMVDSTNAGAPSRSAPDERATVPATVDPVRRVRVPTRPPSTGRTLVTARRASDSYTEPAVVVHAVSVSPVEPPRAVQALRLDPAPRRTLSRRVAVEPPAGTRATVIRTADPKITVVWLSR